MKRTPLRRKFSLRTSFLRKLKQAGTRISYARNRVKRQKPLKKVSRSQRRRLSEYYAVRDEFLNREENRDCRCCLLRRERSENIRQQPSSEVHHARGRNGSLLTDVRFFVPTCYDCGRNWIHQHPTEARAMGLLSSPADWNRVPGDGNQR